MEWSRRRIAAVLVLAVVLVVGAGAVVFLSGGYDADQEAVATATADDRVTVEETEVGYTVRSGPVTDDTTGLVLYPGARVDAESYVPTAASIAAEGDVLVVVPEMPLRLAVLDVDRADDARATVPEIDRWYVGGHSLGGSMACRYAATNAGELEGVVLMASYCDRDLTGTDLRVLSLLGTEDEVLDRADEREARTRLPTESRIVELEGVTHSQFGAYGPQRGDGTPDVSDARARARIADEVVDWIAEREDQEAGTAGAVPSTPGIHPAVRLC